MVQNAAFRLGLAPLLTVLVACGATGSSRSKFEEEGAAAPTPDASTSATEPTPGKAPGDFGNTAPPDQPTEIAEVFGHSDTVLYRLDPDTKAPTVVGTFKGCAAVTDIALDEASNLFGVSTDALYRIDRKTAECTQLAKGDYPNSLSFVPKGTLDPDVEALVGYDKSEYVRIDTTTGKKTVVGSLGGGLESSGDIVSVKGGGTYLTVKGGSACAKVDCLVEVDPKTGKMLKSWGSIEHDKVFGLAFWGGDLYGFDDAGELFEVTFGAKQLATTDIPIPQRPASLRFWGAGSTTSAPLVSHPQ